MGVGEIVGADVGGEKLESFNLVGTEYKSSGVVSEGCETSLQVDISEVVQLSGEHVSKFSNSVKRLKLSPRGTSSETQGASKDRLVANGEVLSSLSRQEIKSCNSSNSEKVDQYACWDVKDMVELFERVSASGLPNFQGCRIRVPVSRSLNIDLWRKKLGSYEDNIVCDFLEFGFPLDFDRKSQLKYDVQRNHKGAQDFPEVIKIENAKICVLWVHSGVIHSQYQLWCLP